jgi:hypothetical protein
VGWKREVKESNSLQIKKPNFYGYNQPKTSCMRNSALRPIRRLFMGSRSGCFCWDIMQCDKSKKCPAKKNPDKPCWEIASENEDDYRNFFNICRDCIVHVIMADSTILSNQEIKNIVETKIRCSLSRKQATRYNQPTNTVVSSPG